MTGLTPLDCCCGCGGCIEPIRCTVVELFVAEDDAEGDPLGKPLLFKKNKYSVSWRNGGETKRKTDLS